MYSLQWQIPDIRVQLLQVHGIIADAGQVDVLFEKLGRCFPERPLWPNTEYFGLPCFLDAPGQYQFRRFEVACSSAFVNRLTENLFFDVPDSAAIPKPWASFASHSCSPIELEAGHPLREIY